MSAKFILHFDQADEAEHNQAGGKGSTLIQLYRAGFPVPPGFVVTSDAYRAFVAANGLDALLVETLVDGDSARIRAAFEEAEIPPSVTAAVRDAYVVLGEGEVAVRSSALAEDSATASFAGQHETFLEISGVDALLAAVRRCWASLWSERALIYRDHLGLDGTPAMAVVVQRMVSAAWAGVAFTRDPVNGSRDAVVVEAVAGTGETLVSGRATPDRYVVGRGEELPQASGGVLDDGRLAAVVRLARDVESWAGQAQDVEWALDGVGEVYLLQARAITAAPRNVCRNQVFQKKPGFYSATHWTRDNVGEVIPDPVTPLSWSVLGPLGNRSFAGVLRRLGLAGYPDAGLFGRFYGHVYFNQTLFQAIMSRFYPSRAGWRAAPRLALTALRALLLLRRQPEESEGVIEMILERRRSEEGLNLAALSPGDVLARLADWRRLGVAVMEVHLAVSVIAELLYQALDKLSACWSDGEVAAAALTTGLTGVRSAETGQALIALARQVCQDKRLRDLVLVTTPETLPARLAETKAGRALWSRIEAFLSEHGHSAAQEFELAAPRWRDEPAVVLGALQAHVRAAVPPLSSPPSGGIEGGIAARLEAVAQVEGRVWLPKRWLFHYLLRWTQSFIVARENLKYHFVVAHSRLRQLYLALADQFVAAGQLNDPDDVFFLTAAEVAALADESLESALDLVVERRRAWAADRRTAPPLAFEQRADGCLHPASLPAAPDDGGQLLHGFAASPGSYTGRARVLRSPTDGAAIEPGEVLVAQATNPGWAPLLLAAGALVTEIGGTLSHGAIIAREYGLPAVLNVAGATRHICTGQIVHVDGSRGTVRLLEEMT